MVSIVVHSGSFSRKQWPPEVSPRALRCVQGQLLSGQAHLWLLISSRGYFRNLTSDFFHQHHVFQVRSCCGLCQNGLPSKAECYSRCEFVYPVSCGGHLAAPACRLLRPVPPWTWVCGRLGFRCPGHAPRGKSLDHRVIPRFIV